MYYAIGIAILIMNCLTMILCIITVVDCRKTRRNCDLLKNAPPTPIERRRAILDELEGRDVRRP